MKTFLICITCTFSALSCTEQLKKSTVSRKLQPYEIAIVDPMGPKDFYHQLYDSLNWFIAKNNGNELGNFIGAKGDPDVVLGWLQHQFENINSGLGKKAACKTEAERVSDEFYLKGNGTTSKDKASFSVSFRTDSIPDEYLNPDLWHRTVSQNHLYNQVKLEKESFKNAGTLIRSNNEEKDTLYVYPYNLNIDITLNYFKKAKGEAIRSKFSIPAKTAVYHQPRFTL